MAPRDLYLERTSRRNLALVSLQRTAGRIATLRLLIFTGAATQVWFTIQGRLPATLLVLPLALFFALVWWASGVEQRAEFARRAIRLYERGLARLENRWQGTGESGERFFDPHHPYSSDLDLFGRASLFELLSTARTRGGEAQLAQWLCNPAPLDLLRQRQVAVDELRPLVNLREQIALLGDDYRTGVHPKILAAWAAAPPRPFAPALRRAAFALSLAAAAALVWWAGTQFIGIEARRTLIVIGCIEAALAATIRTRIKAIVATIEEPAFDLDLLSRILAVLETQQFHSPRLVELRECVQVAGRPASRRIARLRRWVELIDSRDNPFVRVFGPLLLWTTQSGIAIERWRSENGSHVAKWLDAIGEFEALSSLANYAFEHPGDPFPSFDPGRAVFEGDALAHPLLPEEKCVPNSLHLSNPLRLVIVSGSNMSGKSTLLRTVGVNAVLALAGAPVRARSLRLSALSLGASIRATDSLEEGQSRFMAEILRLKQILELPAPALFLLDELLHGTNSHDRAIGSEGLVRALLERGGIGLITTHDLSLAGLADGLMPAAANVHFEDRLENGKLVFDYRMRAGVVTRSNALDLMRAVGLDV